MRKNVLLVTVAATALIVGANMASAQTMGQEQPKASDQMKSDAPKAAPKAAQDTPKAAPKAAQDTPKAKDAQKPAQSTTGQAPREGQGGQMQQRQEGQSGQTQQRQEGQTQQRQDRQEGQTQQRQQGQQGQDRQQGQQGQDRQQGQAGQAQITTEQRTRISSVIKTRSSEARVSNVNFAVSVGTVVPRTVNLVALPDEVIVIHPAWRGYRFFIVNDQIVVVEPDTLRIVAVLPA